MILPTTAEDTGGFCMPCYQGILSQPVNVISALEQLDDEQLKAMGALTVSGKLSSIAEDYPIDSPTDEDRDLLARALSILERFERQGDTSNQMIVLKLMTLGLLERYDEAIAMARGYYQRAPNWHSAIGLANAYVRNGGIDQAIEMFNTAADHDANDVTAYLEIGDLCLLRDEWRMAIEHYEKALSRQPDQPWAIPSVYYCRYRQSGEEVWLNRLQELADAPEDECGMDDLIAEMMGSYSAEYGRLRAQQLFEDLSDESAT